MSGTSLLGEDSSLITRLSKLLRLFVAWRWAFAGVFCASAVMAYIYPFHLAEPAFKSEIQFLPPPSSGGDLLSAIGMSGMGGLQGGTGITNEQVPVVFATEGLRRELVDRFDLIRRYKIQGAAPYKKALKVLDQNISLDFEKSAGLGFSEIISYRISAWDRNPDTARLIAEASFHLLDSAIIQVTSATTRSRLQSTGNRLAEAEHSQDSLKSALVAFQRRTKVAEPEMQGRIVLEAAGKLAERLAESRILLRKIQSESGTDASEAQTLRTTIVATQAELDAILGGASSKGAPPGFSGITEVMPEYLGIRQELEIQTKVVLLLRQQEELGLLDLHRKTSSLQLIDQARVPEYKDRPKRIVLSLVILLGTNILFLAIFIYVFVAKEFLAAIDIRKLFSKEPG